MSPCFLFLIWTVSQVFSTPALLRLFVILSGWHQSSQIFRVFLLPIFQKQEFFRPTRDLSPWALDQKSNALPNWLSGPDESFVLLFLAVILNVRPNFSSVLLLPYRSWWFFLDHGSLLRISMFPCFQFCEKREFWPHTRDSNPWSLE